MADQEYTDAIALLKADHRKVEMLFGRYEDATSSATKKKIAHQICTELKIHTTIEEEIFYPAVRGKIFSTTRRGWVSLPNSLTLNNDEALVDECERGEDHALEVYRNALDDHLPEFVRQIVLRHFEDMMSDHDQVRFLSSDPLQGGLLAASTGGHARQ